MSTGLSLQTVVKYTPVAIQSVLNFSPTSELRLDLRLGLALELRIGLGLEWYFNLGLGYDSQVNMHINSGWVLTEICTKLKL